MLAHLHLPGGLTGMARGQPRLLGGDEALELLEPVQDEVQRWPSGAIRRMSPRACLPVTREIVAQTALARRQMLRTSPASEEGRHSSVSVAPISNWVPTEADSATSSALAVPERWAMDSTVRCTRW